MLPISSADDTRDRVLEAIDALGYRANQAARQMRTGRSRLVAVRIEPTRDGINGSVLDRFLHGLTETAAATGYRVVLYTAGGDDTEIATYDELLAAYQLDGFVLTSTHYGDSRTAWLAAHDVPFVTFGRPWGSRTTDGAAADRDGATGHPWVDVDGAAGTAAATRHLLATGHERIGFIGWPEGSGVGDDRRAGWRHASQAAGYASTGCPGPRRMASPEGAAAAADLLAMRRAADRPRLRQRLARARRDAARGGGGTRDASPRMGARRRVASPGSTTHRSPRRSV